MCRVLDRRRRGRCCRGVFGGGRDIVVEGVVERGRGDEMGCLVGGAQGMRCGVFGGTCGGGVSGGGRVSWMPLLLEIWQCSCWALLNGVEMKKLLLQTWGCGLGVDVIARLRQASAT